MRKKELLHIHALLSNVASDFRERGELSTDGLERYQSLGVSPMSLRNPKADHEEAVLTLSETVAEAATTDRERVSADD
ncbi:MAG: UPF0058 family protein [Halolamina sp.]